MKNLFIIIFVLLASHILVADWVDIQSAAAGNLITYNQNNDSEVELSFALDGYSMQIENYQGTGFTRLNHPDAVSISEDGMPDLPVFSSLITIPDQGDINIEILSLDSISLEDIIIFPCQDQDKDHNNSEQFSLNEEYYTHGDRFPSENVKAGDPAIMRDIRVLPVSIYPFHYNATSKELEIITSMQLKITTSGTKGINIKNRHSLLSRNFEPLYELNTLNYHFLRLREDYQLPLILFICPDDDEVLQNIQPLLDWKRQKGFIVETATTAETGDTVNEIKAYIQNAYDTWANPPEYICLAGDANGEYMVATHFYESEYQYGEGDNFYGELEGDDCLPDAHVGRLSYSTIEELQIIVAKILYYEKNPYLENTNWLEHALLIGDPTHMGYITIDNSLAIKELMLEYPDNWDNDDNFYEIYSGSFPALMNNALENGVSYMFYRGYIGVSNWDPGTQENDFMLPFTTIIGCSTGNFAQETVSDPETMLRMGTVDVPRGAIGAIGQCTCASHTCLASALTIGMTSSLLNDQIHSMGAVLTGGKMTMAQVYPFSDFLSTYVNLISLMGDPSLDLWTKVPESFNITYPDQILIGDNWIQIEVLDEQNNPISDAWVTLTAEDPLEFSVSAFTDNFGNTILPVENITQGGYNLTVTYPDFIPAQYSIEAVNPNYIPEISEAVFTELTGNGDELLNPGETFYLDISLTNYGYQPLSQISTILSSSSSFINIPGNQLIYGDIPAGSTVNPVDDFIFIIDPAALEGMEAEFELTMSDNSGHEWKSWLSAEISGPSLYCSYFSIGDDGILDPGETAILYIELTNDGSVSTSPTQATLSCIDDGIEIIDGQGSFNSIEPGGSVNNINDTFTITASDFLLPGTPVNLMVTLENNSGFNCPVQFSTYIGTQQVTDPCTNDSYGYVCYDDSDTDYDLCPQFDWIEINPDLGGEGNNIPMYSGRRDGQSEVIDLPEDFHFIFYGEDYQQMTICSNGWIAPGVHETASYCNWYLPSPQGPSPVIAVFWDDLRVMDNDDNISWLYDEINHWVIVEWYLSQDNYFADNIFQVILYDCDYYPSLEGNSNIKMQYITVDNSNAPENPEYHGQYATIGLENRDSSSGLLYTYNDQYDITNKPLEDEMALFFTCTTTDYDLPYLRVDNTNILSGDDEFIEAGETVNLDLQIFNYGIYAANNISLEISCNDPFIDIDQNTSHIDLINAHESEYTISPFVFSVHDDVPDFYYFILDLHIESDESFWDRGVQLLAYQPNTFSLDQNSIYLEMDINQTNSREFTLTNTGSSSVEFFVNTRELYDQERDLSNSDVICSTDHFNPGETTDWEFTIFNGSLDEWITDLWIDFPYEVTVNYATDVTGGSGGDLIWDGVHEPGIEANWHGATPSGFGLIHEGESATTSVNVTLSDQYAGSLWIPWQLTGDGFGNEPHTISGNILLRSPLQWIDLDISHGFLQPDEDLLFTIDFDSSDLEPGIYQAEIIISCNSWDQKTLPVTLNVLSNEVNPDQIPEFSSLLNNYPNPFNPSTTIEFQLSQPGNTKLSIYNIKGQLVCTLLDQYLTAGSHSISWNAINNRSQTLSSGLYFYTLTTETQSFTRKMILLK